MDDGLLNRHFLEQVYRTYNVRRCALQDPVSFLYAHDDPLEREAVGLVAAMLAYGRLAQIMRSVREALRLCGGSPRGFVLTEPPAAIREACGGFAHRFADAGALSGMLCGMKRVLEADGSLQSCFLRHDRKDEQTVLPGLIGLARDLRGNDARTGHLLADPSGGSACKRWHLYLRWMVRRDEVDPGGWTCVAPSRLVVPLDTHMWRVWRRLGLTRRRSCGIAAALEITAGLRAIEPEDPVRYDFALMHASVERGLDWLPAEP